MKKAARTYFYFFYFTSSKVKLKKYCPRSSLDIFLLKPNGMDISRKYENAGLVVLGRYINVNNAYRINQVNQDSINNSESYSNIVY